MLSKKDLELIGEVMRKETKEVEIRIGVKFEDLERNLRDEIRSSTLAMKNEIVDEVNTLLVDHVLPQIEELQKAVFPQRYTI